jgi:hypothetical protein
MESKRLHRLGWWCDRAKEAVQALAALVGEIARLIIAIRSITH